MKLTETHIEELYKFTRQHFVVHYDVQTELVDHLANDIESIWQAQPDLSFQDARNISFKKFGVFGFMDVVESRQKAMNKRYIKILWRFFKEWFTLPKLAITTSIFSLLFFLLKTPFSEHIILAGLLLLATYDLIQQFKANKRHKNKEQQKEKIFLLESMIGDTRKGFSGLAFINIFNCLNIIKVPFSTLENHWLLLISFSLTCVILLFYVTGFMMPEKAEELLEQTYPEYKLSKTL